MHTFTLLVSFWEVTDSQSDAFLGIRKRCFVERGHVITDDSKADGFWFDVGPDTSTTEGQARV